jgi:hypothetical protein
LKRGGLAPRSFVIADIAHNRKDQAQLPHVQEGKISVNPR